MDGFHVTKPASGPRSSYVIDDSQIPIIKIETKERNKNKRNKAVVQHAHTQTLKLIPKV